MKTYTIDIISDKALTLLKDLELLKLIRIRKSDAENTDTGKRISGYKGAMKKQKMNELNRQLDELRNAWE
ncbi:MAG: hypothetical protein GXO86_07365 [Chlorobi bacterium]|nr:hypothetical protein [Chlorobiota bacterium]